MTRDTTTSSTLLQHHTYPYQQDEEKEQTQGEYLEAVKRMHARQDAWSRAARSASASGSTSGSGSGSRSPSRPVELQMSSSFGATSGSAVAGEGSRGAEKKGRKKVAKACLACQKSHVTCDDSELFLFTSLKPYVLEGLMNRTTMYSMCQEGHRTAVYRRS
jgi:hypothetical protein